MKLNNYILYAFGMSARSYGVDFNHKILSRKWSWRKSIICFNLCRL